MAWDRYKTDGACNQVKTGREIKSFPVSCANRTVYVSSPLSSTPPIFGIRRDTYSMITPDYWKRKKAGEILPDQPFESSRKEVIQVGSSSWRGDYYPAICTPSLITWDTYVGNFAHGLVPPSGTIYSAIDPGLEGKLFTQTVTECLAKRQQGAANLVESVAELDQLYAMVRRPFNNLQKFHEEFFVSEGYVKLQRMRTINGRGHFIRPFTKVRRKARNSTLHLLAELTTSEYLRYRYGVTPVINDVRQVMKTLRENYKSASSKRIRHTARASGSLNGDKVDNFSSVDYYLTYYWSLSNREKFSVRAKFVDEYTRSPWGDLGFNFQNVIGLPWELLRFSFVADWVWNIGDFIYANIPRVGVTPHGGSAFTVSQKMNYWGYDGFKNMRPPTEAVFSGSLSDGVKLTLTTKRRQVIDTSIYHNTGLVVKSDFKLDNWKRAGDAVSLALQAIRKVRF